jgi:aspartate/methionine/tyrosine aminotransferase
MSKQYERPHGSLISYMSNQVKTRGGINLAQGIPGFQPPEALLQELSRAAMEPVHQYAPGIGNMDLLRSLLEKYQPFGNFHQDNLLITNGATEAVSLLYTYFSQHLKRPYAVLSFEPAYESYRMLPGIFNDGFISFAYQPDGGIDFDRLSRVCHQENVRIVFLNTPGNPYGRIWQEEEVKKLVQICRDQGIYLVLDTVYQELYFWEEPFHPLHHFFDGMFYVNSFSKIFSVTGWRIGYLVASQGHMREIRSIHDYTGLCAPSVLQEALARYIRRHDWGRQYIGDLRQKLARHFNLLKEGLEQLGFHVPEIRGGFFVWARLPQGYNDGFQVAMDLYEKQKVAVIPGEHFSQRHKHYIRLNIAREKQEVEQGLQRLTAYFNPDNEKRV